MNPKLLAAVIAGLLAGSGHVVGDTLYDAKHHAVKKGHARPRPDESGFDWRDCGSQKVEFYSKEKNYSFIKGSDCRQEYGCKGVAGCMGKGDCHASDSAPQEPRPSKTP